MPWLISKLYTSETDRLAIIVGGGPSAPADLARIPNYKDALIISANHHAFKLGLKPKYIWCKDHIRIVSFSPRQRGQRKEYMEPELRRYHTPIVGPNFWCDYRAIGWPMNNHNSGGQAVAFAALMGCRPIVTVGLDCFLNGTYFHDLKATNISNNRKPGYWQSRMRKLHDALRGAMVRALSGPVMEEFGKYDPKALLKGPIVVPPLLQRYGNLPTKWVRIRRDIQDSRDPAATIPAGYVLATDKAESDKLCKLKVAEPLQLFDA